jgi:hypothetical protein
LKTAVCAALFAFVMMTTAVEAASRSHGQTVCPVSASRAIDEAQNILQGNDQTKFNVALACIAQALAQTQSELEGLREGNLAFSGQIYAPRE